jgi:hypothetical protein
VKHSTHLIIAAVLLGGLFVPAPACVGDEQRPSESARADRRFLESEKAALAFAETHHPELAGLLAQLKESAADEYKRAIAELDRSRDRLEKIRERQPDRHAAALKEWQLSSRIKLTLARMTLSKDPTLEPELTAMVRERAELRLQPLRAEQERIKARLDKVGTTLEEYDRDPAAAVEKEVAALLKGNRGMRSKPLAAPKAARKAADSDGPAALSPANAATSAQ